MAARNPLEYAIQLERDGQAFYTQAAAETRNPLGKKMFEGLAADERRHEEVLVGLANKANVALSGGLPKERLVTLFGSLGPTLRAELDADADDTRVIGKALEMERASVELYRAQAQAVEAAKDRALYERLAQEESQHVDILQSTLRYLNDTGHWFVWDEQGVLDGG